MHPLREAMNSKSVAEATVVARRNGKSEEELRAAVRSRLTAKEWALGLGLFPLVVGAIGFVAWAAYVYLPWGFIIAVSVGVGLAAVPVGGLGLGILAIVAGALVAGPIGALIGAVVMLALIVRAKG